VVASLGCETNGASRLIAIGFPTRGGDVRSLTSCAVPKYFISSTHDQFAPRDEMQTLYKEIAEPKQMIWIEAEDHFFRGGLDELEESVLNLGLVVRS
jgi:hypothetical protein